MESRRQRDARHRQRNTRKQAQRSLRRQRNTRKQAKRNA